MGSTEGETPKGKLCRICSISLSKSIHLLLGCYSLSIDGLAQESGALDRLLFEIRELLQYFHNDISRVDQVIEGKLPSAGQIGKLVSSELKIVRDYFSENTSHFSYKPDSIVHLFDKDIKVKSSPTHNIEVFGTNLLGLVEYQGFIIFEAINCLLKIGYDTDSLSMKLMDGFKKKKQKRSLLDTFQEKMMTKSIFQL